MEAEFTRDGLVFEEIPQVILSRDLGAMTLAAVSPGSVIAEEFRGLGARIRAIGDERPFQCVGLVSALAGEGKTTMAIGVAAALAREPGRRVLLVEADVRKPAMDEYLGMRGASGLGEWLLAGSARVPVRRLSPLGFSLLSAGLTHLKEPELVGSKQMARLLESARRVFEFVVVDCPPLLPVADAVMMQDFLDGFLLVIRARKSPLEAIQRAVATLKPGRIQGAVLNDQRDLIPSYYRYAYPHYREYGYGRGYGKDVDKG